MLGLSLMPHLNWRSSNLAQKVVKKVLPASEGQDAQDRDFVFELALSRAQAQELAAALAQVLVPGGGELRLNLPDEWVIFWKLRPDEGNDESRLLIAHPQQDEWVATVALEPGHAERLLNAFSNDAFSNAPCSIRVANLAAEGIISSVSNLELVISVT